VTAEKLVQQAQKLETAGQKQDVEAARPLLEKVREEYMKVSSFLSQPDWDKKAKQQDTEEKAHQTC
jgi:hypothetical protein